MQDFFDPPVKKSSQQQNHYHGETVRKLFLSAGILILISMPLFDNIIPLPSVLVIIGVIALATAAALTSVFQMWVMMLNTILSALFLLLFEIYVLAYHDEHIMFFIVRQLIAIIFLFALYYSVRTLRAMYLHQINTDKE